MKNQNKCIKYTKKQGNQCVVKCQIKKGKESIIPNADQVICCPYCGNALLEMGYARH